MHASVTATHWATIRHDQGPRAVIHGFGAIGRALLAPIFRRSGYAIVGIDPAKARNDAINARGGYDVVVESNDGSTKEAIDEVQVVDARCRDAVRRAYLDAEIAGMALVADAIPEAAGVIVEALRDRVRQRRAKLTLLVALNHPEGAAYVERALREACTRIEGVEVGAIMGAVEVVGSVVDRIARNAGPLDPDPCAVHTEPSGPLPVSPLCGAAAGAGALGRLGGVKIVRDLAPYAEMKLYLSNCAHAMIAYAGHRRGYRTIDEALADEAIRAAVETALFREVGPALVARWGLAADEVRRYARGALERFANRALRDEVRRVARDPVRKLGRSERLVGAARLALAHAIVPRALAGAIVEALHYEDPLVSRAMRARAAHGAEVAEALRELAGLGEEDRALLRLVEEAARPRAVRARDAQRVGASGAEGAIAA